MVLSHALTRFFGPLASLLLVACSGSSASPLVTATPTSTPSPAATTSPTLVPPTATPTTPPPLLQLKPSQTPQGGFAVVLLNQPATGATATFQGRQYPMLRDGERWWAIVGVGALIDPGLYPVSVSFTPPGRTAPASLVVSLAVIDKDFPIERIDLDPATASLLAPDIVQAEIARRAAIFAGFTAQRLWSGAFRPPGRGTITSIYGEGRSYNGGPVTDYHRGTDFSGDTGSPVSAAAAGRVVFAGALRVRGNAVIIDHGVGVFTAYHHLSAIDVAEGQMVAGGDRLGAIGSTGLATGPHLHWEVIVRGVEVDGEPWLKGAEIGP